MTEKMITGIYIRVSTEEQARDGFSIHAQKEKLSKYADANDWDIFDYYIDDGISGKNIEDRKEVIRLLDDIKKGNIQNVLIYKLDRLTRSVKDLIYLIDYFERYHCAFSSQTEKIDTSNAVGRMFVKIIGIFAEFERENLAERVSLGYEQKTREGNYTNTNGVYGYDYIPKEQKLIVNEQEKALVNRIFDLYIDGKSYYKIAKQFNQEKVITKRGGHWAPSTIQSIINNPLYIGKVRYGVYKNFDRSFIVDGHNIEPIISLEKWEAASNLVQLRKKQGVRKYSNEDSYYYPFIRCSQCGGSISPKQQIHRHKKYITYRCNNSFKGICCCKGFSQMNMEKAFVTYLDFLPHLDTSLDPLVSSISLNWEYLNTKEKKEFLERFIDDIQVKKIDDHLIVQEVCFK